MALYAWLDSITTDSNGEFNYDYILDGILGTYQVKAVDSSGSTIAEITFTDNTAPTHNITIKKFGDTDFDGIYDSGEPSLNMQLSI